MDSFFVLVRSPKALIKKIGCHQGQGTSCSDATLPLITSFSPKRSSSVLCRTSSWRLSSCLRIWLERMSTPKTGWSWIWHRAGKTLRGQAWGLWLWILGSHDQVTCYLTFRECFYISWQDIMLSRVRSLLLLECWFWARVLAFPLGCCSCPALGSWLGYNLLIVLLSTSSPALP